MRFLLLAITAPHPRATTVPGMFLPLNGLLGLVTAPPFFKLVTFAAFVLATVVFPLAPAFFFLRAVVARSLLD